VIVGINNSDTDQEVTIPGTTGNHWKDVLNNKTSNGNSGIALTIKDRWGVILAAE